MPAAGMLSRFPSDPPAWWEGLLCHVGEPSPVADLRSSPMRLERSPLPSFPHPFAGFVVRVGHMGGGRTEPVSPLMPQDDVSLASFGHTPFSSLSC